MKHYVMWLWNKREENAIQAGQNFTTGEDAITSILQSPTKTLSGVVYTDPDT